MRLKVKLRLKTISMSNLNILATIMLISAKANKVLFKNHLSLEKQYILKVKILGAVFIIQNKKVYVKVPI